MNLNFGTQTMAQQLPTKLAELIRKRMLQEEGDTKTRKAIRAKTITANDRFTLCIDDSSYTASADLNDAGVNMAFTRGKCTYLAHRLHELTGLPFAVWTDPTSEKWSGHIAIALPSGDYLDVEGIVTNDEVRRRYGMKVSDAVIHETVEQAYAPIGDIAKSQKSLDPIARELINYLCAQLIEEI